MRLSSHILIYNIRLVVGTNTFYYYQVMIYGKKDRSMIIVQFQTFVILSLQLNWIMMEKETPARQVMIVLWIETRK